VDRLNSEMLSPSRTADLQTLRKGLLALTRVELANPKMGDVKEPTVRNEEQREQFRKVKSL
jgi:hypothetical protein